MSIDITRLDCIRGPSIEDARAAIEAFFAARRFALVSPDEGGDEVRRIAIHGEGPWLVVVDGDPLAGDAWAAELSRALGALAIGITAYPDFGAMTVVRYDAGREIGRVEITEDTPRDDDDWLRIKAPFLAELAPEASRASLERGLEIGISPHEMAVMLAKAAALPRPRDKYDLPPDDATHLTFVRPPATTKEREPERATPSAPRAEAAHHAASADEHAAPSADELAALASFLVGLETETAEQVEARQVRAEVRARPPVPGRVEDDGALDNYLGRAWAVGRAQWDGAFDAIEEELLGIVIDLADGLVANFGDDVLGVELHATQAGRTAPVRVGGPLAASTSPRGAAIWRKVRPHLAGGASLRLRGAELHLQHAPRAKEEVAPTGDGPCPVLLEWSVPLPPHDAMIRDLSSCLDAVVRRCARSPHAVEAIVIAQALPGELAYPRMSGLWGAIYKRGWWPAHVAGPAWRAFVPQAAACKLRKEVVEGASVDVVPSGRLVASNAPSPFAMTTEAMNRLGAYLLPAIGTKAELTAMESKMSSR